MIRGVQAVDPRTDARWAALATGPRGSLFTSPPWIRAVSAAYGFAPTARVLVDDEGSPVAGAAWIDVRDLRGQRRVALPFCDRADPIVPDVASWCAVAADALDGALPFTLRCLSTSPAVKDDRFTTVGEAAWHETALDRTEEQLHAAFRPQTRRNIAAAERGGVHVMLSADVEAVRQYHRLHVELRRRKYRLLAQPLAFFERIWAEFAPQDAIRTALAMVDGQPIAGAMYLVWSGAAYYKFGASRSEYLGLRPNDALHWAAMRWARSHGLRRFDWGLSELDQPGLCAYKRKWASVEGRIRTLNLGGAPRGRDADVDRMLAAMTELLTDPAVPVDTSARAGAELYRYFC